MGLAGLALCLACQRPLPAAESGPRLEALRPLHLVLIVVDTLRADAISPYGGPADVSPELAHWAERGVLFERVLSQSSWTKISMASLMTSLWPHTHGISQPRDGLAPAARTLAEVLSEAGYHTAAVQSNGWLDESFGFHQGFDRYVFPKAAEVPRELSASLWPHADRVVAEALRVIDAQDPDVPLFLYVHLMDVHQYAAPPEFRHFGSGNEAAYRAAIRWVDDAIARIRRGIERAGLAQRTLLVLASDHGEAFGEHGYWGHAREVLTATLRVPLILRLPFPVESLRVQAQVRNIDIAPTLLELAGVAVPGTFEGRSLVPLLGGHEAEDRASFAALGFPLYGDSRVQVSLNDGCWTFARNVPPDPHPGELLFDRSVDPGENVNLIDRELGSTSALRERLDRHLAGPGRPAARVRDVRIEPAIAAGLRAMGYLRD